MVIMLMDIIVIFVLSEGYVENRAILIHPRLYRLVAKICKACRKRLTNCTNYELQGAFIC